MLVVGEAVLEQKLYWTPPLSGKTLGNDLPQLSWHHLPPLDANKTSTIQWSIAVPKPSVTLTMWLRFRKSHGLLLKWRHECSPTHRKVLTLSLSNPYESRSVLFLTSLKFSTAPYTAPWVESEGYRAKR